MKCELCRKVELGDYLVVGDSKVAKYNDNAVIVPCCKAEVCKECYTKISAARYREFCGKELSK